VKYFGTFLTPSDRRGVFFFRAAHCNTRLEPANRVVITATTLAEEFYQYFIKDIRRMRDGAAAAAVARCGRFV